MFKKHREGFSGPVGAEHGFAPTGQGLLRYTVFKHVWSLRDQKLNKKSQMLFLAGLSADDRFAILTRRRTWIFST